MKTRMFLALVLLFVLSACSPVMQSQPSAVNATTTGKITLIYATHWLEPQQINGTYFNGVLKSKGLQQYLDEYEALNPNITFEIRQIPYDQYPDKLMLMHETGDVPDIYQIYSTWGVSLINAGALAEPPDYIKQDVTDNYVSLSGVTIGGKIWGIPTEVDDYALIYNKAMFKEAGIVDASGNAKPPVTWNELVDDAVKLTKRNSNGTVERNGIAFLWGADWQVVDPFLVLLFSNNGKYISDDYTKALFDSSEGIDALNAELQLFKRGATDTNANTFDFNTGKVAMIITAPWTKGLIQQAFAENFTRDVGTAPVPYLKKPATLQYSWFMGVMEKSTKKDEAWKFLNWFSSDIQPATGTTRYGDLLADTIGAIPSRRVDIDSHKDVLGDSFTSTYVSVLPQSIAEPNVAEAANIKAILMGQIESVWAGNKTADSALHQAASNIEAILENYYP